MDARLRPHADRGESTNDGGRPYPVFICVVERWRSPDQPDSDARADTNYTATFSTQYLLDTSIAPPGAGSVSNYPAGPWYAAGQAVSLTAKTNTGNRFYYWQGADSALTNTAQVTMNGYHLVQAASYRRTIHTSSSPTAAGRLRAT